MLWFPWVIISLEQTKWKVLTILTGDSRRWCLLMFCSVLSPPPVWELFIQEFLSMGKSVLLIFPTTGFADVTNEAINISCYNWMWDLGLGLQDVAHRCYGAAPMIDSAVDRGTQASCQGSVSLLGEGCVIPEQGLTYKNHTARLWLGHQRITRTGRRR